MLDTNPALRSSDILVDILLFLPRLSIDNFHCLSRCFRRTIEQRQALLPRRIIEQLQMVGTPLGGKKFAYFAITLGFKGSPNPGSQCGTELVISPAYLQKFSPAFLRPVSCLPVCHTIPV